MWENKRTFNLRQQKKEPNYHTTKFFSENLLAIEMSKAQILMNKPVYLRLSILELSQIVIYDFYIKTKYGEKKTV